MGSKNKKDKSIKKHTDMYDEELPQGSSNMVINTNNEPKIGIYTFFEEVTPASAKDLVNFIIQCSYTQMDIELVINSGGGSCSDGFAIINFMKMAKIDIATICVGDVCSMATAIAIAGTKGKRIIAKNTNYMVHTFSSYHMGNSHDLLVNTKQNKVIYNRLLDHYMKHTNMSKKQVKDICLGYTDNYLTPKECLKYGFVDEIREYV